jgi:hypothetical protein
MFLVIHVILIEMEKHLRSCGCRNPGTNNAFNVREAI